MTDEPEMISPLWAVLIVGLLLFTCTIVAILVIH